jgi:Basic region leucine zipper
MKAEAPVPLLPVSAPDNKRQSSVEAENRVKSLARRVMDPECGELSDSGLVPASTESSVSGDEESIDEGDKVSKTKRRHSQDEESRLGEEARKLELRRAYNRRCAASARQRSRTKMKELQLEIEALSSDKKSLQEQHEQLTTQVCLLEKQQKELRQLAGQTGLEPVRSASQNSPRNLAANRQIQLPLPVQGLALQPTPFSLTGVPNDTRVQQLMLLELQRSRLSQGVSTSTIGFASGPVNPITSAPESTEEGNEPQAIDKSPVPSTEMSRITTTAASSPSLVESQFREALLIQQQLQQRKLHEQQRLRLEIEVLQRIALQKQLLLQRQQQMLFLSETPQALLQQRLANSGSPAQSGSPFSL